MHRRFHRVGLSHQWSRRWRLWLPSSTRSWVHVQTSEPRRVCPPPCHMTASSRPGCCCHPCSGLKFKQSPQFIRFFCKGIWRPMYNTWVLPTFVPENNWTLNHRTEVCWHWKQQNSSSVFPAADSLFLAEWVSRFSRFICNFTLAPFCASLTQATLEVLLSPVSLKTYWQTNSIVVLSTRGLN